MKLKIFWLTMIGMTILSACGTSPTPIPTVVLDSNPGASSVPGTATEAPLIDIGSVSASGVIAPARDAKLAFTTGGNIQAVNAALGDNVTGGTVLVEQDNLLLQIQVEQAQRALNELTSQAAIAAAEYEVATARKNLEEIQKDVDSLFYPRASDELIERTQAEIDLAKKQVALTSDAYRQVSRLPDGNPRKAEAQYNMSVAQIRLNNLIAQYNWYVGTPTNTDAAIARANLDTAKAALQEAQWYLAALKGEAIPETASGTRLSQLETARNNLKIAQKRLDDSRLVAPFNGTIAGLDVVNGEYVAPGQIILIVTDSDHFQVETTDLSERDVDKVTIGQKVSIFVEALNGNMDGHVIQISPIADTLGGDVVYKTIIAIDEALPGLRAGMSADVQYIIE